MTRGSDTITRQRQQRFEIARLKPPVMIMNDDLALNRCMYLLYCYSRAIRALIVSDLGTTPLLASISPIGQSLERIGHLITGR